MGVRVLIIDDEVGVLTALTLLLKALGLTATGVQGGKAGIESFRREPFDLVLCDLRMPEVDGLTVLETLRQESSNIPFILMSAHAGHAEIEDASNLGANGFLSKPFAPPQFFEILASLGLGNRPDPARTKAV